MKMRIHKHEWTCPGIAWIDWCFREKKNADGRLKYSCLKLSMLQRKEEYWYRWVFKVFLLGGQPSIQKNDPKVLARLKNGTKWVCQKGAASTATTSREPVNRILTVYWLRATATRKLFIKSTWREDKNAKILKLIQMWEHEWFHNHNHTHRSKAYRSRLKKYTL